MPNSSYTSQENINEISLKLANIKGKAATPPATGKDIAIMDYVDEIREGPLKRLQDQINVNKNKS